MRRTRAILAMLLAAGMATHALVTGPPPVDTPPAVAHALIDTESSQLASVEHHADQEDEVVAVDEDQVLPMRIRVHLGDTHNSE